MKEEERRHSCGLRDIGGREPHRNLGIGVVIVLDEEVLDRGWMFNALLYVPLTISMPYTDLRDTRRNLDQ